MHTCTEASPGVVSPILSAELLGRIHQFNLDYLELLVATASLPNAAPSRYLPDRVVDLLRKTNRDTRQDIAASSFALYSLGFEDQEFWRTALRFDEQPIDGRYAARASTSVQHSFTEVALLHAWHVALTQPIAARMLYAMPSPIIERISHAKLWQLRRIAIDSPGLLVPRWPTNPCFWPELIKFASNGDTRRLHAVQQLGHQLIAIDLQTNTTRRSPVRERQRNLLLQRLRESKAVR